tara:strand:+ start:13950 stop:14798 length:849 start_codon:yes stop_codon:yes gene_type:complete
MYTETGASRAFVTVADGTGTPDPAGYPVTEITPNFIKFVVPEGVEGRVVCETKTESGVTLSVRYVGNLTDTEAVFPVDSPADDSASGDFSITVPVIDSASTDAIAGARVTLLTAAGVTTNATAITGTDGTATVRADADDYLVAVTPPSGYTAPDNVEITVAGDATLDAIEIDGSTVPDAAEPEKCNVAVDAIDQHGIAIEDATVWAVLECDGELTLSGLSTNVSRTYTTNASGRAIVPMIRRSQFGEGGGWYRVEVRYAGKTVKTRYRAPDQATDVLKFKMT